MCRVQRASWALCLLLSAAGTGWGAEYRLHPSLTVSEEFNDNVNDTKDNRQTDFITRLMPGVVWDYKAAALNADLSYQLDYRYYARGKHRNETTHDLAANAHLTAVENLLFLDASDVYQRASLNVTRDLTRESLTLNQSDRNVVTASPFFVFRPLERTTLTTGYRFIDTRYFDSIGINKTDHVGFLEGNHELSKRWSLTGGYTFVREITRADRFSQHQAYGGFRYEYLDKSFLFAQAGNTWTNYDGGRHLNSLFWNVGATHDFGLVVAGATTGVKYDEDPLRTIIRETFATGSLERRLQSGLLGLSAYYSEFVRADTDTLQTRKYGASARASYEFTNRLNGFATFTAEKYDQSGTYTRLLLADAGLEYLLADKLTLSLSHTYVDSYSPVIVTDTRLTNRTMLQITKVF